MRPREFQQLTLSVDFELNVPFELRCRPVLCSIPSTYPDPDAAIRASPPTNKRNLQLTFQQFTLAMNINECYVHLHRPYFAKALYESPGDPTRSKYGPSYLTVVERCHVSMVLNLRLMAGHRCHFLHHLQPVPSDGREALVDLGEWIPWMCLIQQYHAFASAACMGTLLIKSPQNVLANFALTLVDTVMKIYTSVVKGRNSPRMVKNLNWLKTMRSRLDARMTQTPDEGPGMEVVDDGGDDVELLGWRTRLIERAEQGLLRRAIGVSPQSDLSPANAVTQTSQPQLADHTAPNAAAEIPLSGEILV